MWSAGSCTYSKIILKVNILWHLAKIDRDEESDESKWKFNQLLNQTKVLEMIPKLIPINIYSYYTETDSDSCNKPNTP